MQVSPVALTELSGPLALGLAGSEVCSSMPPQNYFLEGQIMTGWDQWKHHARQRVMSQASCLWKHVFSAFVP